MVKQIPYLPFHYTVIILWFIGQFLLGIFRYSGYTTALFKLEASGWDYFINLFVYITTGLGYSFVHVLLIYGIQRLNNSLLKNTSFRFLSVIVDVIFVFWYTADITIQAIELVLQLETSGNVSVDYFFAYMLTYKKQTNQTYYESGDNTVDIGQKIFQYSVQNHGWTYLYLLFAVGLPAVLLITYFVVFLPEHVKTILPQTQKNSIHHSCFFTSRLKQKTTSDNDALLVQQQCDIEQSVVVSTPGGDFSGKRSNIPDGEEGILQPRLRTIQSFEWKCIKFKKVDFQHPILNIFCIFQFASFLCYLIYVCLYAACHDAFRMEAVMPTTVKFINQANMKTLNAKTYQSYVQDFRREKNGYMQRNGLFFLDNREQILFPTVTGTADQFCSFNYEENKTFCDNLLTYLTVTETPKTTKDQIFQPNILFLIIESFSPSPRYVDANYAQKSDGTPKIRPNTTFYNDSIIPNINKLAKSGITIPQATSAGLPTIFGFLGLATTEKPAIGAINIVANRFNDDEAFSRHLKTFYNYYTSYVATTPLEFDYQNAWIFNKNWYDEVHYYYPTETQLKILGLSQGSHASWLSDRISSRITALNVARLFAANGKVTVQEAADRFYTFYNKTPNLQLLTQYLSDQVEILRSSKKIQKNQPIFLQYFSTDTHNPFSGFDNERFYEPFVTNPKDIYQTVLRSCDHYLGEVIELFKLFDNNTLVFLTGDHGQHDETLLKKGGEQLNQNIKMNKKYQFKHVAGDIMFDVSAVIADLQDGNILSTFGIEQNSVLEAAFDHDDLVESLFDILSRCEPKQIEQFNKSDDKQSKNNSEIVTSRKSFKPISGRHGKSIIDTIEQLNNKSYEDDKLYTSFTDVFLQGKYNGKTLRTNTKKIANSVLMTNYIPSYAMFMNGTEVQTFYDDDQLKTNLYSRIIARQLFYTHLGAKNMLYNLQFETETCGYNPGNKNFTLCKLPQNLVADRSYRNDFLLTYFGLIIMAGGIMVSCSVILIFYTINFCQIQRQLKQMQYR